MYKDTFFCPTLFCYITNHLVSNFCQKNKSVLQRLISNAASAYNIPKKKKKLSVILKLYAILYSYTLVM